MMNRFWKTIPLIGLAGLKVRVSKRDGAGTETGVLHVVQTADGEWYARISGTETPVFAAPDRDSYEVRMCSGVLSVESTAGESQTGSRRDPLYLNYTGAGMLQDGDQLAIKGFEEPVTWDGKTNGKGLRVRLGDAPQPVWIDERNIDGVIRRGPTVPRKAGLYRNDDGMLFMLDDSCNWWSLGNGNTVWRLRPTLIDTVQLPLTPVRMEDAA